MTPTQFRAALNAAGLSQARFGRLIGVNKDTPTNYASGSTAVPGAVAIVAELLARGVVSVEQIEALKS